MRTILVLLGLLIMGCATEPVGYIYVAPEPGLEWRAAMRNLAVENSIDDAANSAALQNTINRLSR